MWAPLLSVRAGAIARISGNARAAAMPSGDASMLRRGVGRDAKFRGRG